MDHELWYNCGDRVLLTTDSEFSRGGVPVLRFVFKKGHNKHFDCWLPLEEFHWGFTGRGFVELWRNGGAGFGIGQFTPCTAESIAASERFLHVELDGL